MANDTLNLVNCMIENLVSKLPLSNVVNELSVPCLLAVIMPRNGLISSFFTIASWAVSIDRSGSKAVRLGISQRNRFSVFCRYSSSLYCFSSCCLFFVSLFVA